MMLDPINDVLVKRIKGIHQMVDVAVFLNRLNMMLDSISDVDKDDVLVK